MRSHEKPIRSSAPGPKFSTSTSDSLISFSSTSLPAAVFVSSVNERLLLFSIVKYSASASGMSRSWLRVTSPEPGRSTLITSAPNHASNCVHAGPACTCVKSMILMPSSGLLLIRVLQVGWGLLLHAALRVQVGQSAAFSTGRFVDHGIDQGGLARLDRFLQCMRQFFRRRRVKADAA